MEAQNQQQQVRPHADAAQAQEAFFETQVQLVAARVDSVVHSLRSASAALEALSAPVRQLQAISRGAKF